MKNIINLFVLFLLVSACTEVIDLKLNEGDNEKLVVDAWITNKIGTSSVKLSLSTSYFHNEKAPEVTDALVEIVSENQTITLEHLTGGIYQVPTTFKGEIGKTYQLQIEHKGKEYTSTATMKRIPIIDGIDYTYDPEDKKYEILIFTQEPEGKGDYYLFKTFKNGTLMGDTLQNTDFVDDELVDGSYIDGATIGFGKFEYGDSITVEMWSISEEAYDFFIAISLETAWRGGIFDSPPSNIPTNIKGGALGFFNASAIERKSVLLE